MKKGVLLSVVLLVSLLVGIVGVSCAQPAPQPSSPQAPMPVPQPSPAAKPSPAPQPAKPLEPYRIGVVNNTTGAMGLFGIPQVAGVQLGAEVINKQGGVNGHQLEVIAYDGETKADVNLRMARKLIESDKVDVMIGPNFTPGIAAMAPVVNEAKITMMKFGGYIVDPKKDPWVFSMGSDNKIMAEGMAEYFVKKGYKKIAVLVLKNAFGEEFFQAYKDYFAKYPDIKVTAVEYVMPEDTDISPQVSKLIATNPDIIAGTVAGAPAILAVRTVKQLGFKGPISVTHADSSIAFANSIKDLPAGSALVPTRSGCLPQYTEAMPAGAPREYGLKIMEQWKAKFGSYKDVEMGSWAYEFADIYSQAMKKVGNDRAAIKNWLETNKILTSSGYLQMSTTNHLGSDAKEWVAVLTVKDGQYIAAP